ncbi:MAG: hypothetical protein AAGF77_04735 [Bacteroidota bacterium]
MKNNLLKFFLIVALVSTNQFRAQNDVLVTTQVLPPYSPYFSDYVSYDNRLVIILNNTNPRGGAAEVRLTASITGNNGISLSLSPNFVPTTPIFIPSGGMARLTGRQLEEYFDLNAWNLSGISSAEILRGNGLPEGNYELCVQAIDFDTGVPLSRPAPAGCGFFNINSIEPPIILQPLCESQIASSTPQNLLFSWTVPAGANPQQVEYELVIQEVFNGMDPNQLFLSLPPIPFFQKRINTNTYLYSLADPPLEKGRQYAFRVTAVNRAGFIDANGNIRELNFRNGGGSQVCIFTYGEEDEPIEFVAEQPIYEVVGETIVVNVPIDDLKIEDEQDEPILDPEDSPNCTADCEINSPQNTVPISALNPGQEIIIGKFKLKVTSANLVGNGYNGEGDIFVNFLQVPIKVEFTNLKVNNNGVVFEGKATATNAGGLPANADYLLDEIANPQISAQDFQEAMDFIDDQGHKTPLLQNQSQGVGMPILWKQGSSELALLGMIFKPNKAHINIAAGMELPQAGNQNNTLLISGTNCLRPNGFGSAGVLQLVNDFPISITQYIDHVFKADSFITYNCDGIDNVHLEGAITFSRQLLLPLQGNGNLIPGDTQVTADYETDIDNFNNWYLEIAALSHPFTIPGLVGFKMDASNVVIDQSTTQTANQINKPNSWTGLYLGNMEITLPDFFQKEGNDVVLEADNFSIGNDGVSGSLGPIPNLIPIEKGSVSGWPISVETFAFELEDNNVDTWQVGGNLILPIANTEMAYDLTLDPPDNAEEALGFDCTVTTGQNVAVPMWFADLDIENGSTVTLEKVGNKWTPSANLTGALSINWGENDEVDNNAVSSFNVPQLTFENLTIAVGENNKPIVDFGVLGVTGAQASMAGFEIGFGDQEDPNESGISFRKDNGNGEIGIQLDMYVSLNQAENSIGGNTSFTIWGDWKNNQYKYKRTELGAIGLDMNIGVAWIKGGVEVFTKDGTYGNGFKGHLGVALNPLNVEFNALMQFGSIKNQQEDFRYWYFDVDGKFGPTGIPIPPTMFSIFGGGGGAWFNMTIPKNDYQNENYPRKNIEDLNSLPEITEDGDYAPGYTRSPDDQRLPEEGTYGLSQSLVIGLNSAETVFNADITFGFQIETDGGFGATLFMSGDGYMVQAMNGRDDAATISGGVDMIIATNPPFFESNADFSVNLANILTGTAPLRIRVSEEGWYHKLGEWTNDDEPWEDDARVRLQLGNGVLEDIIDADFYSYFMFGSDIPGMPRFPKKVRDKEAVSPISQRSGVYDATLNGNNEPVGATYPGLAFGAGFHIGTDLDFLGFYLKTQFFTGFDFTFLKRPPNFCMQNPNFGMNRFYAEGQAYAYLSGAAGVRAKIFGKMRTLELMQVDAAVKVKAGLPNPIYIDGKVFVKGEALNGILKFSTDFKIKLGEKCVHGEIPETNPFQDLPIIADVIPVDNNNQTSLLTIPEIAYNFPQEGFDFVELDQEFNEVERRFEYELDYFKFEWKDKNNQNQIRDISSFAAFADDGYSATYYDPNFLFPPKTNITFTIGVTGYEVKDGNRVEVINEQKTGSFKTENYPSSIKYQDILFGKPFVGENYFIPNAHGKKGNIVMKANFPHWTDKDFWHDDVLGLGNYGGLVDGTISFVARFTNLSTKATYEKPYSLYTGHADGNFGGGIKFDIPAALQKDKIYELELLVKYTPPISTLKANDDTRTEVVYTDMLQNAGGNGSGGGGNGIQTLQANFNLNPPNQGLSFTNQVAGNNGPNKTFDIASNDLKEANSNLSITMAARQLLAPQKKSRTVEIPLFKGFNFYFKTSKYNTLAAKLNTLAYETWRSKNYHSNLKLQGDNEVTPIYTSLPVIICSIGENFDYRTVIPIEKTFAGGLAKVTSDPLIVFGKQAFMRQPGLLWGDNNPKNKFWGNNDTRRILYRVPNAYNWGQLTTQLNNKYVALGYDYPPISLWDYLLPSTNSWSKNRFLDKWRYAPFNHRTIPSPHVQGSMSPKRPPYEFYEGSFKKENISHNGKHIGFQKNLLTFSMQAQNTNINQYAVPPSNAYFGVIDYTEWITQRDWWYVNKRIETDNANSYLWLYQIQDLTPPDNFWQVREGVRRWLLNHRYYNWFDRQEGNGRFKIQKFENSGIGKTVNYPTN